MKRKQPLIPMLEFRQDFLSIGEAADLRICLRNQHH